MRSWSYSYKTSDGLRHEAEMAAPSKDAVYEELRKQGIRAIRVEERVVPVVRRGFKGLRCRDWAILLILVSAMVVMTVLFSLESMNKEQSQLYNRPDVVLKSAVASGGTSSEFQKLAQMSEGLLEKHRKRECTIDRELLANYAALQRTDDISDFRNEIERGRSIVCESRSEIMSLFRRMYPLIPPERPEERTEAQRIYGVLMETVDVTDERLSSDECALELLDSNRGAWSVHKGRVVWSDDSMAAVFKMYCRDYAFGTARWKKDFAVEPRGVALEPDIMPEKMRVLGGEGNYEKKSGAPLDTGAGK